MGTSTAGNQDISARLLKCIEELRELEQVLLSGQFQVDARVLAELRGAVNHVRQTAWAAQQWLDLREKRSDPFTVLGHLAQERVKAATQICRDLSIDLDATEVCVTTEGITDLFPAVKGLTDRLARIVKVSGTTS